MLSAREALVLGYLLPTIGTHFRSLELLSSTDPGGSASLRQRLAQRTASLLGQRDETVRDIRQAESLAHKADVRSLPAPHDAETYARWVEHLAQGTHGALSEVAPGVEAWHLLGFLLGQVWSTLNLGGVLLHLRTGSPDHAQLASKIAELRSEHDRLLLRLDGVARQPTWTDGQRAAIVGVLDALRAAPALSPTTDSGALLEALAQAMTPLAERIEALQTLAGSA